ncbi:MAG: hypothetical protein Q8O42_18175 [Acidobacteriota bacterium]|nr:hypothetical protein [Acidobacteriota bacterium]
MRIVPILAGFAALVLNGAILVAQAPDLSGTWVLDKAKSQVVATAGFTGLISAGAPATLHITQPANGSVVVESQVNEQHVRIYKPGGQTSTPAGQGGAVTMTTRWDGRTLVSEGAMKAPNGDTTTVKEVMSLSADGKVLTVQITTTAAETSASALIYTKVTGVGPCETWPTPCKRAPGE